MILLAIRFGFHAMLLITTNRGMRKRTKRRFRPGRVRYPFNANDTIFLLRASVTLANGSKVEWLPHSAISRNAIGFGHNAASAVFAVREQFSFWDGAFKRSEEDRARFYAALNLSAREIFPVTVSGEPGLVVGRVAASIVGLCCLKDFNQVEFYS